MNPTLKRWLVSSVVSFVTGFATVLLMNIDNLQLQDLQGGAWVGIIFLCIRGGVKALAEGFLVDKK